MPTIARYTALEALRARLPRVTILAVLLVLGAGVFFREIALLEGARIQTALYAATMRMTAVFITGLYVLSSLAREFNDKALDAALGLNLPRWQYVVGKFMGHTASAALVAAISALPLLALAGWPQASLWWCSLLLELSLVTALAVFCGIMFSQVLLAGALVACFYLLARSIDSLRLIGEHLSAETESLAHQLLNGLVQALALLVPPLEQWTRTAWLLGREAPWHELRLIAAQTAVYSALLIVAAVIDFRRKDL